LYHRAEISSRRRWQLQKRLQEPKRPKQLQEPKRGQLQERKQLQKQLRKRRRELLQPSYRKRPGRWQRSAKPAGATFSCLCPQKGVNKTGEWNHVQSPQSRKRRGAKDVLQQPLLHIQPAIIRCLRATPYRPKLAEGVTVTDRCKITSTSLSHSRICRGSAV